LDSGGSDACSQHEIFSAISARYLSANSAVKVFLRVRKKLEPQRSLRKTAKIAEKGFSLEILPSA
jgi:hypothetical protein